MRLDSDAIRGYEVGDALELRLVFRSGLIVQMTEISDEEVIALQFSDEIEENALGISLVVGVDANIETFSRPAHVLTVVAQGVDHLFEGDDLAETNHGDRGLRGFSLCDPGGLLASPGYECLRVFIEFLMKGSRAQAKEFCEIEGSDEEE